MPAEEWLSEYKAKLKQAETLLHECETILAKNGIQGPVQHPPVIPRDRIWFPTGYIRKASYFRDAYELKKIIDDVSTRNNIAYSLQLSDFYNYIIGRFFLGNLSLGTTFFRISTTHIFSIIESICYGTIKTLHNHCCTKGTACIKNRKCTYYVKSPSKTNFSDIITTLEIQKLITLTQETTNTIKKSKDARDRIHLWLFSDSDFLDTKFTVKDYNDSITALGEIASGIRTTYDAYCATRNSTCLKHNKQ